MNILFVAYYFPPESSSGSFRPLFFANHLTQLGCSVNILTCKSVCYLPEQPVDCSLLETLDHRITVDRTGVFRPREALIAFKNKLLALGSANNGNSCLSGTCCAASHKERSFFQRCKDVVTDMLAIPDPHIGWLPGAVLRGRKIITDRKIDVVWATGSPWTSFLVGACLKKLTGKPLVLDYRDPWCSNPNMCLKSKWISGVEYKLEKFVVSQADLIVANTEELKENFLKRFHFLTENKVITLPNGFERIFEPTACNNSALTLTHAGAVYFSRNPFNLLKAACDLLSEGVIPEGRLRIKFVGGISIDDADLKTVLDSPRLKNVVEILPRMVLDKAIAHQQKSDILFLLQPGFPLQIPRKLYEYISLRKTILAITDRDGATARVVEENNFGVVVENTVADLKVALKKLWVDWSNGQLSAPSPKNSEKFLNSNISKRLYASLVLLTERGTEDASR